MQTETNQPQARGKGGASRPVTCSLGLRLDAGEESAPSVWNPVAYEGEFAGHHAGPFAFTRTTFEQIVANFRADPRYQARASMPAVAEATAEQVASGAYDVVQWDFHHASEMDPRGGNVAAQGVPAQGWVLDLKVGEYEGKCALYALSRFLEPARGYIRAGQYKWCSVSVWLNAPDPITGKEMGAVLTSIAVTNNPFLQGLPSLKASRDPSGQLQLGYYGPAATEDEAFGCIRRIVGLLEAADVAAVAARMVEVRAWIAGGARPTGIDDDCTAAETVSAFRQLLSMPLLSTTDGVLAAVDALLKNIAAVNQQGAIAPAVTNSPAATAAMSQESLMDTNATGAKNGATDAPLPAALLVAGGPDLRLTLAKLIAKQRNCSVDDVSDGHILVLAENAAGLQTQIDDLMTALGAKSLADALVKIGAADELKEKLGEALTGKKAAEDALSGYEGDMVEEDVGMALASLGITDASKAGKVRNALLAERGKTPETISAFRATYDLDALRKDARAKLTEAAKQVVADRNSGAPGHIAASIATERQTPPALPQNDTQPEGLALTMGADGRITLGAAQSREAGPGAGQSQVTMASLRQQYPHEPNDFARKVAFAKAEHAKNNPSAKALTHDTACEHAHDMRLAG